MKIKVREHRKGVRISGESSGDEELLYTEAECARYGDADPLLPFSYKQKGTGYRFVYQAGLARPLPKVLSVSVASDHFESMLISFSSLARTCETHGLSLQRVSFEADHILFDPALYSLRFLYVPVRGRTGSLSSPLEALKRLAKGAKLRDERTRSLADQVLDHALRSLLLSWADYEELLRTQGVLEDGRCGGPALSPSSTQVPHSGDHRGGYGFDFMGAQKPTTPSHSRGPCLVRLENGAAWPLKEGSTVVGAGAGCGLQLRGLKGLSRKHVAFQLTACGCKLMDLDSTNGVKLNGKRIPPGVPVAVREGDRIQLARTLFTVRDVPC